MKINPISYSIKKQNTTSINFKKKVDCDELDTCSFQKNDSSQDIDELTSLSIDKLSEKKGRKLNKNYIMFAIGKFFEDCGLTNEAQKIYKKNLDLAQAGSQDYFDAQIDLQRINEKINEK